MSEAKIYRFRVSHPGYGEVIVASVGPESATNAAAKVWDAPWREIAGYCGVEKLGPAGRPRCKRCHREYGQDGDPAALCLDCLKVMETFRRDRGRFLAERGRVDRRVKDREEE